MKIYNTESSRKEEFNPLGSEVRMYVCGVTPYDYSHIGHAMSYIFFDVIRRYLKYRGYKVKYVQNFTDIDDKIINRANQLGIPSEELAGKFIDSFLTDMKALNVVPADVYPRATGEVDKIIEVVEGLIDKGFAYAANGSVYFRVRKAPDYGKLSHRSVDSLMSGARVEPGEEKEDPLDFALWKAAKPGEPSWDSPWGKGRPGWHIECTAMSLKYLGEQLDIHGGGQDLIFPHHENEVAQSESFTGKKPFARYWMHNGLLQLGGEKMSKSLGNLVTIRDALKKYSPDALRLFFLQSNYRSPLSYSEEAIDAAEKGADRLRQALSPGDETKSIASLDLQSCKDRFISAMDDDFNSAQAVATLFDLARDINRLKDEGYNVASGQALLRELGREVMGLTFKEPERVAADSKPFIDLLISIRNDLRKAKQFQLADNIRKGLEELGIVLEDTAKGTSWKQK